MADNKTELMFNNAAREAQVAEDVEIIWDQKRARNDKLDAAERIVHAARTHALPPPFAREAVGTVWRVLANNNARQLAQQIRANIVKRYPDYIMP